MVTMCKQFCEHSKVIQRDQGCFSELGNTPSFPGWNAWNPATALGLWGHPAKAWELCYWNEAQASDRDTWDMVAMGAAFPYGFCVEAIDAESRYRGESCRKVETKNIQKLRYDKIRSDTIRISILQLFQQGIARYEVCLRLRWTTLADICMRTGNGLTSLVQL